MGAVERGGQLPGGRASGIIVHLIDQERGTVQPERRALPVEDPGHELGCGGVIGPGAGKLVEDLGSMHGLGDRSAQPGGAHDPDHATRALRYRGLPGRMCLERAVLAAVRLHDHVAVTRRQLGKRLARGPELARFGIEHACLADAPARTRALLARAARPVPRDRSPRRPRKSPRRALPGHARHGVHVGRGGEEHVLSRLRELAAQRLQQRRLAAAPDHGGDPGQDVELVR